MKARFDFPYAGCDESGKGDYFGVPVCACVIASPEAVALWQAQQIRDCKQLSNAHIPSWAERIRHTPGVVAETASLPPAEYNRRLRPRAYNLNDLLIDLHTEALARALDRHWVRYGVIDQFADTERFHLQFKGSGTSIILEKHADQQDAVVAAASICARAGFLAQLDELSRLAGETLLRGANRRALEQATRLMHRHGPDILPRIAKTHFKPIRRLMEAHACGQIYLA